ncbi:hypothetical protein A6A08_11430 [Nocardiopsis sp. TSRI0078]|uniref:hypothetical protein n=1 Tax=unclassified Nocardiopsis TaxID=2649073 RepID=UPI0009398919|nr:hypothetical protein [Nocardiopsis sp. TSRI0078]OKI15131.1 hypothetical protein A6A08_11430 [Nocardiopsis sp. TSRI0078]
MASVHGDGAWSGAAGRWTARLLPWAVGLVAGVLALGPALGPGYVLRYDMVFVPDPSLGTVLRGADGFPRAIPSDAVVAVLSLVLPGDLVQSLALSAVFAVGGAGAARLASRAVYRGGAAGGPAAGSLGAVLAPVAAGLAYVWNPFVAERLLLGQWAVLLGYAGLPWAVGAAARLATARPVAGFAGLVRALVPAAVGGFSSVVLTALTAGPVALRTDGAGGNRAGTAGEADRGVRWWGRAGLFALALVTASLPWLLPSLSSGADTDPAGVEAFAARSDTPFGVVGSLLLLGGVWNSGAVPAGYGEPVTASVRLLLCLVALAGWVWWLRRERPGFGTGLSAAALLGFALALLGATGPGRELLTWLIGLWPGFGPLRDGQLYVAPLALVQALGLGACVRWLAGGRSLRGAEASDGSGEGHRALGKGRGGIGSLGRVGLAVFALLLPVAVLPGLLWGAGGRLTPVHYPEEWRAAQAAVAADDRPGAVLVLPWSAYRGPDWSGRPVVVLDPATKLFDRRTLWNDDLVVGTPDGGSVVVSGEDARARRVARVLEPDPRTGMPERLEAGTLGALGVRHVVVSAPVDNRFWSGVEGLSVVVEGPDMVLLRVHEQHVSPDKAVIPGLEVTGGLVTVGAIIWSVARSGSSLVFQRSGPSAGSGARKEIPK